MIRPHAPSPAVTVSALVASLLAAAPAIAQSNTLFVEQSGVGNTISVEQSAAIGSTLGTVDTPVTQSGAYNRLTIFDGGTGNLMPSISQDNATGGNTLAPNEATITMGPNTNAARIGVMQGPLDGTLSGNNVAIIDFALGSGATIVQAGTGNRAALTVNGPGSSGSVTQTGSGNDGALTVTGVDAIVSLTQTGTDLAFDGGPAGVDFTNGVPGGISVVTNGVTVNIVQEN